MSKISIVYATRTKHSQKLAQAIGNALSAPVNNASEKPSLGEADLLFLVGGIYAGKCMPELVTFAGGLDADKIKGVALVTSCSSGKQGLNEVRKALSDKGIPVVDEFICPGSFLFMKTGHPNESDIRAAVEFADKVAGSVDSGSY